MCLLTPSVVSPSALVFIQFLQDCRPNCVTPVDMVDMVDMAGYDPSVALKKLYPRGTYVHCSPALNEGRGCIFAR